MKNIISVQFDRKRKKATDYRKRLKLLSSGKERLVIRKTSSHIIIQIASFGENGDSVLASASSSQLAKYGWALGKKSIPAAYLTGLLAGKFALSKNIKHAILDAGTQKPASRGKVYAALKGAIDAGLEVPASKDIFPSEERIAGKHIADHLSSAKSPSQFSLYKKNDITPEKVTRLFDAVKAKISGGTKNG